MPLWPKGSRKAATSAYAIVDSASRAKWGAYHRKVTQAWTTAHPNTPLPGSQPSHPMPADGLEAITGLRFRPAVFDVFGGCSEDTAQLFMEYAKWVACRRGKTAKYVFNGIYSRFSYCIWSFNAQAIILRRPIVVWPPR